MCPRQLRGDLYQEQIPCQTSQRSVLQAAAAGGEGVNKSVPGQTIIWHLVEGAGMPASYL